MSPAHQKPPITFPEYERLFRTIHAIVANEKGDPSKACLFFAIAGAYLLAKHHGLREARPMAGFAGYNLRLPTNLVLLLGAVSENETASHEDAFHCWIEVEGYVLDLTAPLFDQMAPQDRKGSRVRPQLFQKPQGTGVGSVEQLNSPGAYMHVRNPDLLAALMARFTQLRANEDLVNICLQWYVRPPKRMAPYVGVGNQHGQVQQVPLSPVQLEGAW